MFRTKKLDECCKDRCCVLVGQMKTALLEIRGRFFATRGSDE